MNFLCILKEVLHVVLLFFSELWTVSLDILCGSLEITQSARVCVLVMSQKCSGCHLCVHPLDALL